MPILSQVMPHTWRWCQEPYLEEPYVPEETQSDAQVISSKGSTMYPYLKTSLSLSPTNISPMDTHGPSDPTPITFDQENPFVAMPAGGVLYDYHNDGIGGHDANTLTQQF